MCEEELRLAGIGMANAVTKEVGVNDAEVWVKLCESPCLGARGGEEDGERVAKEERAAAAV